VESEAADNMASARGILDDDYDDDDNDDINDDNNDNNNNNNNLFGLMNFTFSEAIHRLTLVLSRYSLSILNLRYISFILRNHFFLTMSIYFPEFCKFTMFVIFIIFL
jgi:hypothetical protein